MKHKLLFFLYLLICSLPAWSQRQEVTGHLISDENAQPVQLADLLNKTTHQKVISNRQGYFRIQVSPEDKISFSAIGFESMTINGSDLLTYKTSDTVKILMHSTVYHLSDVIVTYSNAKRDSIARAVAEIFKTDPLLNNNDRILKRPRGTPGAGGMMGYTGAITEMYYQFSKAGQDMVKFEAFVKYYREVQQADKRYNKEVIKKTTGLPDYALDDFILFCKMDRGFIIRATDYDLIKAIQDCGERYKAANNIH